MSLRNETGSFTYGELLAHDRDWAERARNLSKGAQPLLRCDNKAAVTSLREIAESKVRFGEDVETAVREYLDETKARGLKEPSRHEGK